MSVKQREAEQERGIAGLSMANDEVGVKECPATYSNSSGKSKTMKCKKKRLRQSQSQSEPESIALQTVNPEAKSASDEEQVARDSDGTLKRMKFLEELAMLGDEGAGTEPEDDAVKQGDENAQQADGHAAASKKRMSKKEQLLKKAAEANNRGVCYLSRIPPRMDHVKLRQLLSQYGEIMRIYLAPSGREPKIGRKKLKPGGYQDVEFSEGWVEFARKGIAKRVANMLNGQEIGGKKRSAFYYDLWNIKYLSKFKWDDLTDETAYRNAVREQKLALEITAAKRERDFYLSKVEQSKAQRSIEERLQKKAHKAPGSNTELPIRQPKVIRQFPQNKPVDGNKEQSKARISEDTLAKIFAGA